MYKTMTNIMKKAKDTRTFREVWQSLDTYKRLSLQGFMMTNALIAPNTLAVWATGARNPKAVNKNKLVDGLKSLFGIETSSDTLFPDKQLAMINEAYAFVAPDKPNEEEEMI